MKKSQEQPADAAELRQRAEQQARKRQKGQRSEAGDQRTAMDPARLVHELQVHQIELEMQNEELREARTKADALLAQYTELYDFAPAGYMTIDREGAIRQVNLTGAGLLGVERSQLVNRRFGLFVAEDERRAFNEFLQNVFAGQTKECCEVTLLPEGGHPRFVRIKGTRSADGQECRAVMLDLTERKQKEDRLQLFRTLIDHSSDAIEVLDPETLRYLDCNDKACQDLRYSRDELLTMSVFDIDPALKQSDLGGLNDQLRRSGSAALETTHRRKDGSTFPVEVNIARVTIDRPYQITVVRDITGRKQAEEHRERLAALVEASPDFIGFADAKTTQIQFINKHGRRMCGIGKDEDVGKLKISDLHPAWMNQRLAEVVLPTAVRDGVWEGEGAFLHRNGHEIPVLMALMARKAANGEVDIFHTVSRDITEHKRAEAALRESETRLAAIVDSAMDGIITTDEQERILVFNAAAEKMFGCSAAETIGRPVECFIPERFRAKPHGGLQRFGQMGTTQRAALQFHRVGGLRASGEEFPLEASISCAKVHDHMLFTIMLRDITERVRSEEIRAQLEAQLRLAHKIEALGTLAGGIAHDFNNILGAIIGNTELARQDVGADHPAMESLDEISKASHRAKDLVQRILAFTSQRQEPQRVIALRPVMEEALTLLRATLPAGVEIAATFDAGAPTVLADSTQIHQVLINLCTNAWQAMEGHRGRIDIRLDGITLDAEAARADANLRPGHFARLCVTDTGTGMDAATLGCIFDPFFTTKPVGEGTGLGLSVVYGIVQAYGGAITVTSQPGRGTTFTLYFPAVEAPEQSAAAEDAAPKPHPAAGGQHVLYLDDEEPLVFLMTRMLERLGYRVSGYVRAEEALAAVRADPGQFDLVVSDLNMPRMSGLDVARELARLRPDLPVLLTSGYLTEEVREQALQLGVRELIYKPNTVEDLCAAVQRFAGAPK